MLKPIIGIGCVAIANDSLSAKVGRSDEYVAAMLRPLWTSATLLSLPAQNGKNGLFPGSDHAVGMVPVAFSPAQYHPSGKVVSVISAVMVPVPVVAAPVLSAISGAPSGLCEMGLSPQMPILTADPAPPEDTRMNNVVRVTGANIGNGYR